MRKVFKIILYIIGSIILLIILLMVFLQTQMGKSFVRRQAVSYLQKKLKTEVRIDKFDYSIPDKISLGGVFIRDLKKDTLLNVDNLAINLDMWGLIKGKISVDNILLEGVNAHVYRNKPDSVFNYDFIIQAFAGGDTTQAAAPADTGKSAPLNLSVGKVTLKKIRLVYNDVTGGTYFSMNLGNLVLRIKKLDLDKMKFDVEEFSVSQLQSHFATDTSYLPPPPKDTSAPSDFQLAADKVHLDNIQFSFLGKQDSTFFGIKLGTLDADIKRFGLLSQSADLNTFRVENIQSSVVFGKPKGKGNIAKIDTADKDTGSYHWKVNAANLMLNKIGFTFDDNAAPRMASGMDYSHLDFKGLSLNAGKVYYSSDTISGNLKHAALTEKCGLNIIEFRTDFLYCNQGALLKELYLLTPGTELQKLLQVNYPSLAAIQKDMNKMKLNIDIEKSKVSMKDVMLFMMPEQKKMLMAYSKQQFRLATKMNGRLDALNIQNFAANGLYGTEILMNGKLNGLPDQNKINYNLNILKLRSTYRDIEPFLTDSVKMMVNIPDWFMVNGHISGTTLDYRPDVAIRTSDGDAKVAGSVLMSPGEGKEKYEIAFSAKELNIGKILRQDSLMGKVTMDGNAKGVSFDVNKMNTSFNANLQSLWAMNYNYNSIQLAGNIADKAGSIKGNATDPNLNFTLDAIFNISGKYPSVKGDLNIANLDPMALGLYADTLRFKGDIHADFESVNPDYPAGLLTIDEPKLKMAGYQLDLDSVYLQSRPDADSVQDIYANLANILHLDLKGHIPLTKIGDAFLAHINNHYRIFDSVQPPSNYDFVVNAKAVYQPVLRTWLPQLKRFDTIRLNTVVRPDTFSIFGYVPRLINGTDRLDSGVVKVYETGDTLRYGVSLKSITSGQYKLWNPAIMGGVRKDSLYTRVVLKDSVGATQFAFGAAANHDLKSDSGLTSLRVFKGMVINYEPWNVNPANRFVFGPKGFYVRDFAMTKGDESITIASEEPVFGSLLEMNINNFSLANITKMISKDTLVADGKLNASVQMEYRDTFPDIYATASIKNLLAYNQPVGDIDLRANNTGADIYSMLLKWSGNQNEVTIGGDYFLVPVDSNEFKFNLDVKALNLKSLEGLTFGSIKNSSGFIRGQMDIFGTVARPKITGELKTDQLVTTVAMLNTPYSMPSESILFDNTGITFNDFGIYDKFKSKLSIDGKVKTRSWSRFFLDLNVSANKWMASNSTKKDNESFYGKLILSTDLTLKGLATAPSVEGQLQLHDSTNFTYAMIDNGPGLQASDGIVRFIDSRDTFFIDSTQIIAKRNMRVNRSSTMNINVGIDKNATFNVVIDPITGDNLQVKGEANLNTEIGADGSIGLTGTYELQDGYYELNYNFIKKKFKIQSGSTIALSGDPLDAEVDITAVYAVNIAPYELVEKQQSESGDANKYKQRLPFQILLKLKGKVMKPDISFDIVLPETTENTASSSVTDQVQSKLNEIRNDPSTLNKQVFAALILGRFVAEDPFSSGSDAGFEYAARQSASRFLSDQLNNLAGQLVQGFELNVAVESTEDYSTNTKTNRTDLSVSASKRLFSDRLNVTIGNDFQLEGQQGQSQQSSLIPGNLSADYKLSQDGRYMVRGYRANQMQNIIDGYVIETGVAFRITVEYNRFKNIFRNREKERQRRAAAIQKEAAKKEDTVE